MAWSSWGTAGEQGVIKSAEVRNDGRRYQVRLQTAGKPQCIQLTYDEWLDLMSSDPEAADYAQTETINDRFWRRARALLATHSIACDV